MTAGTYGAIAGIALAAVAGVCIARAVTSRAALTAELESARAELAACQNTVKIDSELRRINAERIRQVNTRLEKINAADEKIRENLDNLGDTSPLDAGVCDTALAAYDMLVCGAGSDAVPSP